MRESPSNGRVSIALGGVLEAVPRENLSRRLAAALSASPVPRLGARAVRPFSETGVFHRS